MDAASDEKYRAACERERELWLKAKGFVPGHPKHDPTVWQQWLEAADVVRTMARAREKDEGHR